MIDRVMGCCGRLLVLGVVAMLGWSTAAQAQPIEIAVVRDPQTAAQVALADQMGLFAAQGLDVRVRWMASSQDVMAALAAGTQHLATGTTVAQVELAARKAPIRTVAALAEISAGLGLAIGPGWTVDGPRALEGRKLAFSPAEPSYLLLAVWARDYGLDPRRVVLVDLPASEAVAAAVRGDVHGILSGPPYLDRLVAESGTLFADARGVRVDGANEPSVGVGPPLSAHAVLMASDAWIAGRRDPLIRVIAALRAANELIERDREAALGALERPLRLDRANLRVALERARLGLTLTSAVAASVQSVSGQMMALGRLGQAIEPEWVLAPETLRAVDPVLVTWTPRPLPPREDVGFLRAPAEPESSRSDGRGD